MKTPEKKTEPAIIHLLPMTSRVRVARMPLGNSMQEEMANVQ